MVQITSPLGASRTSSMWAMPSSMRSASTAAVRWWCAGRSTATKLRSASANPCVSVGRAICCTSLTGRENMAQGRVNMTARADRRIPVLRSEHGPVLVWLLPLLFLGFLFLLPVVRLLMLSIEGGTLVHFQKALFGELYHRVFFDTIKIAMIVTLVSLLLAYPVAHVLSTASPQWVLIGFVFLMLPFWTSILVRTYAWMILLGRNGVLNQILTGLGLVSEPVVLLYNVSGVLIGMVHVLLPYMVFPIYSAMLRVDRDLLLAAEGLGASGLSVFWRVYLPLTLPGVIAGTALVFILSLGFYITPALLCGGRVIMIAVLIGQQVRQFLVWGFASARSIVWLSFALRAFFGLNRTGGGVPHDPTILHDNASLLLDDGAARAYGLGLSILDVAAPSRV